MFTPVRVLAFLLGLSLFLIFANDTWAQSNNFVPISLGPIANGNLSSIYINAPQGEVTLGGVDFDIPTPNNIAISARSTVSSFSVSTNVDNASKVHILINSWDTWHYYRSIKLGEVKLELDGSQEYKTDLVIGQNIREWREGNDIIGTVNTVTDPNSQEVFRGQPTHLAGPAVLDMLTISLPDNLKGKTLTAVTVVDTLTGPYWPSDPNLFWAGLTVEQESGGLAVPYFSQKDPAWGNLEYDSGNSLDLWCGKTIAQCGCALTSAAMLLKYYGVDRSPAGEPTNPETLNRWLKNRQSGYSNGNLNWIDVARYAKEAHDVFGTPKIDYVGYVDNENFDLLDDDLSSDRPVILQISSVNANTHFITATGISGSTYSINDPILLTNTSLQSYNNHFKTMRRYSLTNTNLSAILLSIPSPGSILIIDSQGRKLGKDPETGEIFEEIPNGQYYLQEPITDDTLENSTAPPEGSGNYYIEILDPQEGEYSIKVAGDNLNAVIFGYDQNGDVSGDPFNINGKQEFKLDYSPEPGSQIQVTQIVDVDLKSGGNPNTINLKSKGVIPAVILTTPSFNATQVDVSTVKFGPGQATETHGQSHPEDVDGDGDMDLILHFNTQDAGIQQTDTQVCIVGKTFDGDLFEGCDSVKVISK